MSNVWGFGEQIDGVPTRVLNGRAVRASAGIPYFFAIVADMNARLTGNFQPTRVFVVAFPVDFAILIFVSPRLAPSVIIGRWFACEQQPEHVDAPQKRFAWATGFALAMLNAAELMPGNASRITLESESEPEPEPERE